MTDPFDALRAPVTPADPDPVFAARLRARLERALGLPEGVAVTDIAPALAAREAPPQPAERGAAVPYLAVRGARGALDWYAAVLGARPRGEPVVMPDGRIGHAELELAGGVIYLADEHPEIGVRAPDPAGVPVSLVLEVTDVDDVAGAAVEAGARLDRGPYEAHGHRNVTLTDPYGHRWMLQAPLPGAAAGGRAQLPSTAAGGRAQLPSVAAGGRAPLSRTAAGGGAPEPGAAAGPGRTPLRQGDIGYASLWVPDVARAAAFYGAVLGVEYAPEHGPRGWQAAGLTPPQGLWETDAGPALFCSYVVDDAAAAVARVRAAGGEAGEPVRRAYGLSADCVDPDGVRFALYQPPAARAGAAGFAGPVGSAGPAGPSGAPPAGAQPGQGTGRAGDIIYVTLEVSDPARTLAFYGAVLGWRSRPGRTPGGWQVEDTTPMVGVSGGHARPAAVPVWQVSDVAAAVARVRAAGGTSTEPHREPYGTIAECADYQGTRFSVTQRPASAGTMGA